MFSGFFIVFCSTKKKWRGRQKKNMNRSVRLWWCRCTTIIRLSVNIVLPIFIRCLAKLFIPTTKIYFMIAVGRLGKRVIAFSLNAHKHTFIHTNRKWRQIESQLKRVSVCVVRGMQNADNMTDFGRKFWIHHCFVLKSDMLSVWALIII